MKNVYDIKEDKGLLYILDSTILSKSMEKILTQSAIIIFLYYFEDIEKYQEYINNISKEIDVYVISSRQQLLDAVYKLNSGKNFKYVLKKDARGRDVAALLIEGKEILAQYKYVCFLHDKRAHYIEQQDDVNLWIKNIWGNLIGNDETHIQQILDIFESNANIGVLTPPDPIGEYFCSWYGMGWHGSYDITKKITEKLKLNCNISKDIPPLGLGTALWFRTTALEKLFKYPWIINDFDDSRLSDANYLSYGIERVFAYVAQDAGYDTGEVMTLEYAKMQTLIVKRETMEIYKRMYEFYPFPTVESAKKVQENMDRVLKASKGKKVYLYGAGLMGRFCLANLRRQGIEPVAFLVTDGGDKFVDSLRVERIENWKNDVESLIVITPINEKVKKEIEYNLNFNEITNYIKFWD